MVVLFFPSFEIVSGVGDLRVWEDGGVVFCCFLGLAIEPEEGREFVADGRHGEVVMYQCPDGLKEAVRSLD